MFFKLDIKDPTNVPDLHSIIFPPTLRQHFASIPLVVNSGEDVNDEDFILPYPVKAMDAYINKQPSFLFI